MNAAFKFAAILSLSLLTACQPAPIVVELTPGMAGERQSLEGYFSFISPANFEPELEEKSVFISDPAGEVFISLAIIGEGEDERTAQGLLDDIFERFDRVEVKDAQATTLDGASGVKADFSGVINGGVVSGYYVNIDLGNDVSFLAFGMGKVTETADSWQQYGKSNFTQLLGTVDILFRLPF